MFFHVLTALTSRRGLFQAASTEFTHCVYMYLYSETKTPRVATVREKYLENEFFPGQGKVREICGWSGKFKKDLESQGI